MTHPIQKIINAEQLFMLGDLDVRTIATKNTALLAKEYFSHIDNFVTNAAQFRSVFSNIIELSKADEILKESGAQLGMENAFVDLAQGKKLQNDLENMKDLFNKMGYFKLDTLLEQLISTIAHNTLFLSAKLSLEIIEDFDSLYTRLHTVCSRPPSDESKDLSADYGLPLSVLVNRLEKERKMRILVVDDVAMILNNVISVLKPHYDVFALRNGAQVGTFLEQTTPDLFLLDIEMPGLNGFDLVSVIRRNPKHIDTPIIFLTGVTSPGNLKEAVSLGACDFVAKPVEQQILLEKIAQHIVKKSVF